VGELPTGTVTFLFTDVEGSTRLWEQYPGAMKAALARHDVLLREAIEGRGGHVVKATGDGFLGVFTTALGAIGAAADAQRALGSEEWVATGPIKVRMGLHTGTAELRDGDYYGPAVNRAARIMAAAHGGQVVLSHITAELVGEDLPEGLTLVDLGEHRLRDLARAELVYQLCGPGLAREFAVLASASVVRGNLPTALSSFVGRDADLAEVAEALTSTRVVTLVGVGGVGKTRLGLQSAAVLGSAYRDGAWWCELAGVRDLDGVPDAVAGALSLAARDGVSMTETLLEFLRAKDLLLVLDNCEHLTRPVAALVHTVEEVCPGVRVLATSREGLKVGGEQMVMVAALGVPENDSDLGAIRASDAVRLFVERGRAVRPDFVIDEENCGAVARLCRRLDGLPLAIELAAARLAVLTPDELARRLDRRFQILTGGERTAVERHQTLRAAVDWSYDLLEPAEQRLFDRLGVFTGGFSLDAAETVCAGEGIDESEIFELLARLVARSLVVADAERTETRYRQLETIRQYAQEHLAATQTNAIRARHAQYYAALATATAPKLAGPDEDLWAGRLSNEAANLQGALNWALEHGDTDVALRLTTICAYHHVSTTEVGRTMRAGAEAAAELSGADTHALYASVLTQAAWDSLEQGDLDRAQRFADRAFTVCQERDSELSAVYWSLRSSLATRHGHDDEASEATSQVVAECRASGDTIGLAEALGGLAINRPDLHPAQSRAAAEEVVELLPHVSSARTKVQALSAAGFAFAIKEPERGFDLVRSALALAETAGIRGLGQPTAIAAGMAARRGDTTAALELYAAALPDLRWTGASFPIGGILGTLSGLLADRDPEGAAVIQGAAERLVGTHMPSQHSEEQYQHGRAILDECLSPQRRAELNARGRAMNETEATDYALGVIDHTIASESPTPR
jgi:predicted ATPase/class 3 adenylate cyclase